MGKDTNPKNKEGKTPVDLAQKFWSEARRNQILNYINSTWLKKSNKRKANFEENGTTLKKVKKI